jgi:hypothetical protein
MSERHRPSETHAPRPSDRIADRLHLLAAWSLRTGITVRVDGWILDGHALADLAAAQERSEEELLARWQAFRDFYVSYTASMRDREKLLRTAIDEMEQHRHDEETRRSLRLCKLRRPPLAKVRAAVAEARRAAG